MFHLRAITPGDLETVLHHRRRMFVDMGWPDDEYLDRVIVNFRLWLLRKFETDEYLGWFAEDDHTRVAAGAGLLLLDFPPNYKDPSPTRGYLLNFYVEPDSRGHGLGRRLLEEAMEESRRRGLGVVTLHASEFGRPLYARYGFEDSNEMMFRNQIS